MPNLQLPACFGTGLIDGTLGIILGSTSLAGGLLATVCSASGAKTPVVLLLRIVVRTTEIQPHNAKIWKKCSSIAAKQYVRIFSVVYHWLRGLRLPRLVSIIAFHMYLRLYRYTVPAKCEPTIMIHGVFNDALRDVISTAHGIQRNSVGIWCKYHIVYQIEFWKLWETVRN
jgi:hypothetical protein